MPADVALDRCFERSIFELTREENRSFDMSRELFEAWSSRVERYDKPGSLFLIHTADAHLLRATVRLCAERPLQSAAIIICTPYETRHMPGRTAGREPDRALYLLTRSPQFGRSVFFATETERLAALYSGRLQTTVRSLPLPAPAWSFKPAPTQPNDLLTLAYVGIARVDKGFLDLPELIGAVEADDKLRARVSFIVHAAPPMGGLTGDLIDAVRAISRMNCVRTLPNALDAAAYRKLLFRVDGLVLPYHPNFYSARGSGILVEGFSCGKIIVGRRSAEIDDHADLGVTFTYESIAVWTERLRYIVDRKAQLVGMASRRAELFRQSRSPRAYINRLLN